MTSDGSPRPKDDIAPPKPKSKASFYLAKKKRQNESEERAANARNSIFAEDSKRTKRKVRMMPP